MTPQTISFAKASLTERVIFNSTAFRDEVNPKKVSKTYIVKLSHDEVTEIFKANDLDVNEDWVFEIIPQEKTLVFGKEVKPFTFVKMVVKPETVKRVRTEAQLEGDALKSKWFADEKADGRKPCKEFLGS